MLPTDHPLLRDLNEEQRGAVTSTAPSILCLAGAGTGKTRTLTHRIAWVYEKHGVGFPYIMAITFTRNAAREMQERLVTLCGESAKKAFIDTFHGWAIAILREAGHRVGVPRDFIIYDDEDTAAILKSIKEDQALTCSVSALKEAVDEVETGISGDLDISRGVREFLYRLKQAGAITLDMILQRARDALRLPDVGADWRRRYPYVFVDELQDTDPVQMEMLLALRPQHVFGVGDDYQAIYGFRGADVRNILDFPKLFADCEVHRLEVNYRSTVPIVAAANRLIQHNKDKTEKVLRTETMGTGIVTMERGDPEAEAKAIASQILAFHKVAKVPMSHFAVLTRTNDQLRVLQRVLEEKEIPTFLISNKALPFSDPNFRKVLAAVEWAYTGSEFKLKAILNWPQPRIAWSDVKAAETSALRTGSLENELRALADGETRPSLAVLFASLDELRKKTYEDTTIVGMFLDAAHKTGYIDFLHEQQLQNRLEKLKAALRSLKRWNERRAEVGKPTDPMSFVRWLYTMDMQARLELEQEEGVRLLTIHGAKGLEWDVVFVAGLSEGLFPAAPVREWEMEEERRVAYVAITRARHLLYLTRPGTVTGYNKKPRPVEPSRFLLEALGAEVLA